MFLAVSCNRSWSVRQPEIDAPPGNDENLTRSLREGSRLMRCASGEVWGEGVLEFLGDEEARDLRAGAVLPDEVYVL